MGGTYGRVGAVIVAAGASTRMDGTDKVRADLGGRPLLAYPLQAFESCPQVDALVLVVSTANLAWARDLTRVLALGKLREVCPGGPRRQDSVRLGLEALGPCDWVLVHDGARPFVSPRLIEDALAAAQDTGAAVPALPLADTVKEVEGTQVLRTLDRSRLRAIQTPQAFRYTLLLEAHRRARGEATDDAALVEALGATVRVFPGSPYNLKVTTPPDLELARALLATGALEHDAQHRHRL
ncbi:MAG TPA: 2-C-methyl-D-erythritol 4-phosphate cytidylyltransferase [Dehalococcoidia bacterium]|nr:2-C-methyl-D-erythritol 4-phosphate cytidylyltransferase [Dehalococcoidia bacterium]